MFLTYTFEYTFENKQNVMLLETSYTLINRVKEWANSIRKYLLCTTE